MNAGDFARRYADAGLHVFPCWPNTKQPATKHGLRDATIDRAQITEWWSRWPRANIGLSAGPSGLVIVDFDIPKPGFAGDDLLNELLKTPTTTATTASGGLHFYYLQPEGEALGNGRGRLPVGVDCRGAGGYVLMPVSTVTYTGDDATRRKLPPGYTGAYAWENKAKPAPLPDLLADLLKPEPAQESKESKAAYRSTVDSYIGARLQAEVMAVRYAANGARNDRLNLAAWRLGRLVGAGRLTDGEVRAALLDAALAAGLGEREAAATIASGLRAGVQHG